MSAINALLLGTLMYRSRAVPRLIPLLGLVGAPLLIIGTTGTIFGLWEQSSVVGAFSAFIVAAWELSLGLWLTLRGFRADAFSAPVTPP